MLHKQILQSSSRESREGVSGRGTACAKVLGYERAHDADPTNDSKSIELLLLPRCNEAGVSQECVGCPTVCCPGLVLISLASVSPPSLSLKVKKRKRHGVLGPSVFGVQPRGQLLPVWSEDPIAQKLSSSNTPVHIVNSVDLLPVCVPLRDKDRARTFQQPTSGAKRAG